MGRQSILVLFVLLLSKIVQSCELSLVHFSALTYFNLLPFFDILHLIQFHVDDSY